MSFTVTKILEMELAQLNSHLADILDHKVKLSKLDYSSEEYDEIEEGLHNLEDEFIEKYGDYLEDALHEVHDEFCPDTDVLLPTAYLPRFALVSNGSFDAKYDDGVYVEVDDYPGKETKLVLLPDPVRIVLNIDQNTREVVWEAN